MTPGGPTEAVLRAETLRSDLEEAGQTSLPDPLALTQPVGLGQANTNRDVVSVRALFDHIAHPDVGLKGLAGTPPSIQTFQSKLGLKPDGILTPGGPTEAKLNQLAAPLQALQQLNASGPEGAERRALFSTNEDSTPRGTQVAQVVEPQSSPDSPTDAPNLESSYSSRFTEYRQNLAPWEGGIADRPAHEDQGGLTNQGMSQKELDKLRKTKRWAHLPARSDQLTDEQITYVFHEEYYARPQIEKLASVPGLAEAAPKLAEQIFDSGVLHGISDAGRWLQEAIDETMGSDLRVPNAQGVFEYDGIVGSGTRAALEDAIAAGKGKEINNIIVQKRLEHFKNVNSYQHNKGGWGRRARSFLIP